MKQQDERYIYKNTKWKHNQLTGTYLQNTHTQTWANNHIQEQTYYKNKQKQNAVKYTPTI